MEWLRNWSWRLAILALPWQTRYIVHIIPTPEAGYQTEWGMYAVYVSWILIVFAWIVSLSLHAQKIRLTKIGWLVIGLLLVPIALHPATYVFQWIGQLVCLGLLIDALRRNQVSRTELAAWFLISLVPHVFLAVLQFDTQRIAANKWLGVAAQDPALPGASVIGNGRTLRAYAGFPHPNIAGMWFALGLGAAYWVARKSYTRWQIVLAWMMAAVLPIVLVLTFSRSAWIAALAVLVSALAAIFRRPVDVYSLRLVVLSILCVLIAVIPVSPQLRDRATLALPLEAKSVNERASTWQGIWLVIAESPITGHGIGQSIPVMQDRGLGNQPPHALPLIVLLEVGILGFIALLLAITLHVKAGDYSDRAMLLILAIPAFTDHYFWSLWSGQTIIGFCAAWFALRYLRIDKTANS